MSAVNLIIGLLPFVIIAAVALSIVPLYRQWLHPSRVISLTLNISAALAAAGILLPMPGAVLITWWLLAVATGVGVVLAVRRIVLDPPPAAPQPAEGRSLTRAERTREKAIRPVPWWELALNVLLWLVLLGTMLVGGR